MNFLTNDAIDRIRRDYYSAVYFHRTKEVLLAEKNFTPVTMQIFQRNNDVLLCGAGEVVELLQQATGYWQGRKWVNCWKTLEVKTLTDGDTLRAKEPVLHITGPYVYFAHLESVYLGILARRTLVATNVRRAVDAAGGKPVMFFADRFDYFANQEGDGYAAHIGGAAGICTPAHRSWWNGKPVGTIPHALIAINNGDTVKAARQFVKHYPRVPLIVLVDYHNDCVRTALDVANALGKRIWGMRLDTSQDMVDVSVAKTKEAGVTPEVVRMVRSALDSKGHNHVKIVVSGGFTAEKIMTFENAHVPVNVYGIGSWFLKGNNDFTADIVKVHGKPEAKVGRRFHAIHRS
ncbi:MAG: quinolinate phosphoribosyl transferase [Patescibacteria group bacterium]